MSTACGRGSSSEPSSGFTLSSLGVHPTVSLSPAARPSTVLRHESRRARPRSRRLRGPVRPADDRRPARGDRARRGRAGRDRDRLSRARRGAGRARPRGGDRVPGPDRVAAGAQVAAAAAGAGGGADSSSRPRRRPRSCSRGCSSTAATATRPPTSRSCSPTGRRYLYRSAPLPPELRRVALDAARPVVRARPARGLDRRPAARRRRSPTSRHIRPTVSLDKRLRVLRELLAGRELARLRRELRRRGQADPGGDPVRAARAAQAGRGDLGAGRGLRRDRRCEAAR